jgi:hypothetical protein
MTDDMQRRTRQGRVSIHQEQEAGQFCSHSDGIGEIVVDFLRVPAALAAGATIAHG